MGRKPNTAWQQELDLKKWEQSKAVGKDMSGDMPYCAYCEWEFSSHCTVSQKEREKLCLCAKAHRMYQKENNGD